MEWLKRPESMGIVDLGVMDRDTDTGVTGLRESWLRFVAGKNGLPKTRFMTIDLGSSPD
jgi:hypothetical protein